ARNREPVLLDTLFDFVYANALTTDFGPALVSLTPSLRFTFPTSIRSRAQEHIVGIGPGIATRVPVKDVMAGLLFGLDFRWTHNFQGTNITTTETDYPCFSLTATENRCSQTGGPTSDRDAIILSFFASLSPIPNMTIDLGFLWWWRVGHELADAVVPVDTAPGGQIVIEDMSATHMRLATQFSLGMSYSWVPWFNTSFGINTFSAEFAEDGSRRNPFFNIYDSTIQLTSSFILDQLYTDLFEADDAEGLKTNPSNIVKQADRRMAF
ncbi:MAG: hypothetical protein KC416_12665, partial [Myxococcales bacterium]|nr:hypothetical protein [Myxococcales bacterium]